MPARVRLQDIVDALQMQFDESSSYLNLDTGEVAAISHEFLQMAEEFPDEPPPNLVGWQLDEWKEAKQIVFTDRFLPLPAKFDVHEWAIMDEFTRTVSSGSVREELRDAIHGAGAFRHFKSTIRRHKMEDFWYKFRDQAPEEIARDWCDENNIAYK